MSRALFLKRSYFCALTIESSCAFNFVIGPSEPSISSRKLPSLASKTKGWIVNPVAGEPALTHLDSSDQADPKAAEPRPPYPSPPLSPPRV